MSERMPRADVTDDPWFVALDVDGTIMHEDESIDPVAGRCASVTRSAP